MSTSATLDPEGLKGWGHGGELGSRPFVDPRVSRSAWLGPSACPVECTGPGVWGRRAGHVLHGWVVTYVPQGRTGEGSSATGATSAETGGTRRPSTRPRTHPLSRQGPGGGRPECKGSNNTREPGRRRPATRPCVLAGVKGTPGAPRTTVDSGTSGTYPAPKDSQSLGVGSRTGPGLTPSAHPSCCFPDSGRSDR